jgi:molybdenum cofactor cytidylyltransferase
LTAAAVAAILADVNARIAGVLLAAGSSSRMGGPNKLLLELEGESLLRRAAKRALAAGLDPVVVVLGHDAERVRNDLAGLHVLPVVNMEYARGVNGSLRTGIAAVPEDASAAIVLLADMPFVTEEMLRAVAARFRESEAPLVVSEYEGAQAPPTLYERSLFPEILALGDGEGGGKAVVARNVARAEKVSWPGGLLRDIDLREDWDAVGPPEV